MDFFTSSNGVATLATYDAQGLHFYLSDPLGTRRVQTDPTGAVEGQDTSLPFGDGFAQTAQDDPAAQHYAQLTFDPETGLDHAEARQYAAWMGRWTAPDPYNGSYDLNNPQSLNRYAYVNNNPLGFVDPSGKDPFLTVTVICGGFSGACAGAGFALGPVGAAVVAAVAVAGELASLGYELGWWGGPSFQGSLQPRPSVPQTPSAPSNTGLFSCAANFANQYSIAGGLNSLGIGNSGGVGGFLTNALGGNTFSGLTNAVNNGVSVADVAFSGTNMGFGGATAAQEGISGIVNNTVAGGFWSAATGAGQTIQTLNGAASLASTGIDAAEFASGVGEAKLAYDGLSYVAGLFHCY
jgi:RHS repeat-associated protein